MYHRATAAAAHAARKTHGAESAVIREARTAARTALGATRLSPAQAREVDGIVSRVIERRSNPAVPTRGMLRRQERDLMRRAVAACQQAREEYYGTPEVYLDTIYRVGMTIYPTLASVCSSAMYAVSQDIERVRGQLANIDGRPITPYTRASDELQTRARTRRAALRGQVRDQYVREIISRGGDIEIEGNYDTETLDIEDWDRQTGLAVLACEGWRRYGLQPARRASLSYLCGVDDSGPWAVRVPGSIRSISGAMEWVEPAAVRNAREAGRRVLRQGDVYAVECGDRRDRADGDDLPESHEWAHTSRILLHEGHAPLQVPFPCRFYRQRAYEMGRSGRQGYGD